MSVYRVKFGRFEDYFEDERITYDKNDNEGGKV